MIYKDKGLYPRYIDVWGKKFLNKLRQAEKIGEIGGGQGNLFLYLIDKGLSSNKMWGWEKDKKMVQISKKNGLQVEYWDAVEKIQNQHRGCEVIFCLDVIEHLEEPEKLMRNLSEMLVSGGEAIISTPNPRSLSKFILREKWYGYKDKTHRYFFENRELKRMAELVGFVMVGNKTVSTTGIFIYDQLIGRTKMGGQWLIRLRKK